MRQVFSEVMPTSAPTQEQIEAWDRVEREFRERGFLAPSVNVIIEHARYEMAAWFELADELNRLRQAMYVGATELLRAVQRKIPSQWAFN